MNLTIIIPTRNRFEEIKNILKYYKNNIFTGKIFIIDSSSLKIFNQTKNFLKKFKPKNVKHFRFIGRPFECNIILLINRRINSCDISAGPS